MNKLSLKQKNVVKLYKDWQNKVKLANRAEERYYLSFCALAEKDVENVVALTNN